MCGIAGKIYLKSGKIDERDLALMSDKIAHRGPDDQGIYISPDRKVGLVHRRLAIIDLSAAGHQPMTYKNRYWITFNGEIYNFWAERKKLEKYGYKFKSKSDTEVILALYDKWGVKCVDHLRGMFAFAIYDIQKQTVFLARDRVGKKPLKYFFNSEIFAFASELKALLILPEIKAEPDTGVLETYLAYGYVPAPQTGFKNIYKLEPGHYLTLDLKHKTLNKHCYWEIDFTKKLDLSENEWKTQILQTLEESTRLRMISDVPIGAFLSGGVDSSSIVAMMAKLSAKPIKTFTIGFSETQYDESKYAQIVSDIFHTQHTVLQVKPGSVDILPELAGQFEEPFADNSALVTYLVSKLARQYVTVILNGDGGDENFTGYAHHLKLQRDYLLSPLAKYFPVGRYLKSLHHGVLEKYFEYKTHFNFENPKNVYRSAYQNAKAADIRDKILSADFKYYLPDDLLAKVDLASMKAALECRSPLLDYKMAELAAQIPFALKVKRNCAKYIFKKSLEDLLPKEILHRPKMGFSIPLSKWFSQELNPYARSILLDKKSHINNVYPKNQIAQMLDEHSEKNDFGPQLWKLLMLELWWKNYFQ
ncbi:MAG: Asparagine synthetase [Candidatus Amesbacteria bacterium GW2011_GWA1_46_35]|uniref:asparagine synthase (glutamine-hydrolyzing) n=1 Tax=Candidatus Amesbacteria bacterium GW2011_GWC2_45_19 TaxID=1618366 RepID=A0A0G1M5K3_9BACT|nr:MAG: Asparagine synthetase [Candidatus Amesbacteria bacterium GW2011_GWC2_45_19]KKU38446.1 MAG: Asparagine synthetase [Candidatus Amesbacteria bacterium GW2011_GWA1_46_35]KKU69476.1 MAG: Asparagine synthetase [Microgenomates group bacterium GW2011_GWC1_47_20]